MLLEDVAPLEHDGKSYALYRTADDRFYATDGHCTHEDVELADGFVSGTIIECRCTMVGLISRLVRPKARLPVSTLKRIP
jgi:Rieske [2Fe-2S] domain